MLFKTICLNEEGYKMGESPLELFKKVVETIREKAELPKEKRFNFERKGYRKSEVDSILDSMLPVLQATADLLEELFQERRKNEERIKYLEEELEKKRKEEVEIKEMLLMAERLGDQILEEGRRKAEEMVKGAEEKVLALKAEIAQLSEKKRKFLDSSMAELREVMSFIESLAERDIMVGTEIGESGRKSGQEEGEKWDVLLKSEEDEGNE